MPAYQLPPQSSQFILRPLWFCRWPTELALSTASTSRYRRCVSPNTSGLLMAEKWDDRSWAFLEGVRWLCCSQVCGRLRCSCTNDHTVYSNANHPDHVINSSQPHFFQLHVPWSVFRVKVGVHLASRAFYTQDFYSSNICIG